MRNTQVCRAAAATLLPLLFAANTAYAESYIFNSSKTEVRFSYVMGLSTQRGRFSRVEGTLRYD